MHTGRTTLVMQGSSFASALAVLAHPEFENGLLSIGTVFSFPSIKLGKSFAVLERITSRRIRWKAVTGERNAKVRYNCIFSIQLAKVWANEPPEVIWAICNPDSKVIEFGRRHAVVNTIGPLKSSSSSSVSRSSPPPVTDKRSSPGSRCPASVMPATRELR
ncbi:hypothetical protein H4582DRAFT_2124759 [Lactarius indigo]|nr:hypothetical protein H4582DRAFT_2124759 [Lactarius indigo]